MANRKYRIHIKCDCEEEVKEQLREAAAIIVDLRQAQKNYNGTYGHELRDIQMEKEAVADAWIDKHKIYYQ